MSLESNLTRGYNYMFGFCAPRDEHIFGITEAGFSVVFYNASSMLNFGLSRDILGLTMAGGAPIGTGVSESCARTFRSFKS